MQLTQRQKAMIGRYLREVAVELDAAVPEAQRESALMQVEERIRQGLRALNQTHPDDVDIMGVLSRLGKPAALVSGVPGGTMSNFRPGWFSEEGGVIWLGVCSAVAQYADVPVWVVRTIVLLLGVLAAPLAILGYLAGYGALRFYAEKPMPEVDIPQIAIRTLTTLVGIVFLALTSHYAMRMLYWGHERFMKKALPALGAWGWLEYNYGWLLFMTLCWCLPLAALSAMPLSSGWSYSLKRFLQALVALYGIVLSFGLAAMLVGVLLRFAAEFNGGSLF